MTSNRRQLFRGAGVVTADADLGTLLDGDVLVDGDTIADVGTSLEVEDCEVIDCTGKIIAPGFVDSHRHLWQTSLRGLCSNMSTIEYMWTVRLHLAPHLTAEDLYLATYLGGLEALNAGVTTISGYEHNIADEDDARAGVAGMRDSGLRGVFGFGMLVPFTRPTEWSGDPFERAPLLSRLRDELRGADSLIELGVSAGEIGVQPGETVLDQYRLARELGLKISHHTAVIPGTETDIDLLDGAGLLDESVLLVHANACGPEELARIAAAGAAISVQTEVELGMAIGPTTLVGQRAAGMAPTLGIDTVAANGGDMFAQMRLALNTVCVGEAESLRLEGKSPVELSVTCEDAVEWGTINGARALGLGDQTGSITPGKQADLVLIDAGDIVFAGSFREDPAAAVVYQAGAGQVEAVLVAGRRVKWDGELQGVDVPREIARLRESQDGILARVERTAGRTGFRSLIPDPPPEIAVFDL